MYERANDHKLVAHVNSFISKTISQTPEEEKGKVNLQGIFPTSPFLTTRSTTSPYSTTKLNGPHASATVEFAPSVNADNTEGTTGKLLNVNWLNIAWLVAVVHGVENDFQINSFQTFIEPERGVRSARDRDGPIRGRVVSGNEENWVSSVLQWHSAKSVGSSTQLILSTSMTHIMSVYPEEKTQQAQKCSEREDSVLKW